MGKLGVLAVTVLLIGAVQANAQRDPKHQVWCENRTVPHYCEGRVKAPVSSQRFELLSFIQSIEPFEQGAPVFITFARPDDGGPVIVSAHGMGAHRTYRMQSQPLVNTGQFGPWASEYVDFSKLSPGDLAVSAKIAGDGQFLPVRVHSHSGSACPLDRFQSYSVTLRSNLALSNLSARIETATDDGIRRAVTVAELPLIGAFRPFQIEIPCRSFGVAGNYVLSVGAQRRSRPDEAVTDFYRFYHSGTACETTK
jgi:hypothetical protein